jgi:hypothetical protein
MGVCFFAGFAVAVVTALAKTSFGRKKQPAKKEFMISRSSGRDIEPRVR